MITAITPTGDRPEAFELTRKWMATQTMKVDQWLVIDDGKTPLPDHLKEGLDYVRRTPRQGEAFHTLTLNMKTAIPYIKGDVILIIEDDDWYGPTYVETMVRFLKEYDLVGESHARYYHVATQLCKRIMNPSHASFCQTGFTRKLLPIFVRCLEGDPYIDMRLWAAVTSSKYLITDTDDTLKLHCSMKGLKGRKGIGTGHDPRNVKSRALQYLVDYELKYLITWVGRENARIYMDHVGQSFESCLLLKEGKKPVKKIKTVIPSSPPPPPPRLDPFLTKDSSISVLTCTGDRPESFELLRKWMSRQTVQPRQWLVIDDGRVPIEPKPEFEYFRREPATEEYPHTLCLNMLEAIPRLVGDKIVIMEDDDWYAPNYIEYMSNLLNRTDMAGMSNVLFYYPSISKYMIKSVAKQPPFGQTVFNRKLLKVIKEICEKAASEYDLCGKGLIDVFLWQHSLVMEERPEVIQLFVSLKVASGEVLPKGTIINPPFPLSLLKRAQRNQGARFLRQKGISASKMVIQREDYIVVGMKGLPGRKGLTTHHNIENQKYKDDPDYTLLKQTLKEDANLYINMSQNKA
jgi:hypothetical protein